MNGLVNFVCVGAAGLAGCACVFVVLCALGWPERKAARRARAAADQLIEAAAADLDSAVLRHPASRAAHLEAAQERLAAPQAVELSDDEWDAWFEIEAWLEGPDPGWDDIIRMFPREATNREATNYGEDL